MMLLAISLFATDDGEFEALSKAAANCNRSVVTRAWTDEVKRHSGFLLDSYREQREIAAARVDLAERRRKLRSGVPLPPGAAPDTEQSLTLLGESIADRQTALDDMRQLDRQQEEMVGYFRQLYLSQCQGRAS
jgi:hypothetical protein